MEELKVILFYKFVEIADPEAFAEGHKVFCKELGVVGKVLVAKEGINGSLSGEVSKMEEYKEFLRSYDFLKDVWFKEEAVVENTFTKMSVFVKDEIVSINAEVDISITPEHVSPERFKELIEDPEVVILDARNDYEYKVGHFRGAVNSNTRTFREFPEFITEFKKENRDKKIAIYCTGGIRCEKAGALMKAEGFGEVYQLEGGVINYCQTLPGTEWEGKCFVFDKRLVTDVENKGETIGECFTCKGKSDLYKNCKYSLCDRFDVMCNPCQVKLHGCCSLECRDKFWEETRQKAEMKHGILAV